MLSLSGHPLIEKIGNLLYERIGLNTASVGQSSLEYAVKDRMRSVGSPNLEDYWLRLGSSLELQALIETIVVPETWFFRHPEAFAGMVDLVMGIWLPQHPQGSLRVLSLPCSTGEEPFSVAIALVRAGFPLERLRIDALDVSAKALQQAKEGLYRPYSFRNEDVSFRDQYFSPEDGHYRLNQEVQSLVHFQEGNILALDSVLASQDYDLIFCRNLLIYLHEDSRKAAIANLASRLKVGGWLFTGAAEATFFRGDPFRPIGINGISAFEKVNEKPRAEWRNEGIPTVIKRPIARPISFPRPLRAVPSLPDIPTVPAALASLDKATSESSSESLQAVLELADAGQFDKANHLCDLHLETYGESAEAFCLLALLSDARGNPDEAENYYRKALYLAPDHVEAMHHLASLLALKGDDAQATQLRERARRVTTRLDR